MSRIIWSPEKGWHDGEDVRVSMDQRGRLQSHPSATTGDRVRIRRGYRTVYGTPLESIYPECYALVGQVIRDQGDTLFVRFPGDVLGRSIFKHHLEKIGETE